MNMKPMRDIKLLCGELVITGTRGRRPVEPLVFAFGVLLVFVVVVALHILVRE